MRLASSIYRIRCFLRDLNSVSSPGTFHALWDGNVACILVICVKYALHFVSYNIVAYRSGVHGVTKSVTHEGKEKICVREVAKMEGYLSHIT